MHHTQAELEALAKKTKKIMAMNYALHPRGDVERNQIVLSILNHNRDLRHYDFSNWILK